MEATMTKECQQIVDKIIPTPQHVTLPYYGDQNDLRTYQRCPSIDDAERICTLQSHVIIETRNGEARQVKINGKVRRWKRDRNRIEIPMKYGLYEYFTFGAEDVGSILIPV
jgi:hypothetical protein